MSGAIRGHGQLVRILPAKRDMARSALQFGRSGGCAAGCVNCLYLCVCGEPYGAEEPREGRSRDAEGVRK